jgi:membrane-bound lytic murein transglycosylase B
MDNAESLLSARVGFNDSPDDAYKSISGVLDRTGWEAWDDWGVSLRQN